MHLSRRMMNDIARGKDPARAHRDELDRRRMEDGPTREYSRGDVLEVWHQQAKIAIVRVVGRLRDHSLEVSEGETKGKITFVGREVRLRVITPVRERVFRNVTLKKVAR